MTWAVIHGDASWADHEQITLEERNAVDDLLSAWVTAGPPQDRSRILAGLMLLEHQMENGIAVTYFVDDDQSLVGILRIRRF